MLLAATVAVPAAAAEQAATPPSTRLTVGNYQVQVPTAWPIVDLTSDPAACYRVDQHAAFAGHPGGGQCPPHLVGRTETVLVEPLDSAIATEAPIDVTALAGQVPAMPAVESLTHQLRIEVTDARVVVTITWGRDWSAIASVLASGRVVGTASGAPAETPPSSTTTTPSTTTPPAPTAPNTTAPPSTTPPSTNTPSTTTAPSTGAPPTTASWAPTARSITPVKFSSASVAAPADPGGALVSGKGFDSCSLPPASLMGTLRNMTGWRVAGFYLGGVNAACPSARLGASWVSSVTAGGWGLAPLWVGLQAPASQCSSCAQLSPARAATQGSSEAISAITVARTMGMGVTSPIYYDMESYVRGSASGPVISFLRGWTNELHRLGYRSGVYSSGASGIADLVATYRTAHPDFVWVADWNGSASISDPYLPAGDWPNHQRIHQYASSDMHGPINLPGFSLQYDSDIADTQLVAQGPDPTLVRAAGKYVNFIYKAVLGRPADAGGNGAFIPEIVAGVSRTSILQRLILSNEGLRRDVALDFRYLLGRSPSASESNYWTWILATSHRNDVVQEHLLYSAEFYRRSGNTIPAFVTALYRALFGRDPDPSGLSYWSARISRGTVRLVVTTAFVDSVEASRRAVTDVYVVFLHRGPDPGGLSYWTSQYRRAFDLFPVEVAIGSSGEAWNVAQRS